jgi:hypothetical protein
MMDRREALLLVDRLKRRTRDPDVLTIAVAFVLASTRPAR